MKYGFYVNILRNISHKKDFSPDWNNCEASDRNKVRTPKVTELWKAGNKKNVRI